MTTLLVALIGLAAMFTPVQAVLQESKVPESAVPVYGRLMPAQAMWTIISVYDKIKEFARLVAEWCLDCYRPPVVMRPQMTGMPYL